MSRVATAVVVALALAAAGTLCVLAARFERRMAIAQEDMTVFEMAGPAQDFAELEAALAGVPWVSASALREIRERRAILQYWQGQYADLVEVASAAASDESEGAEADPKLHALAANALFRVAQAGGQDRPTLLKNLEAVVAAYVGALRSGNGSPDLAYNYELAVRLRDAVGAGKLKSIAPPNNDDTETDPNMHGDPGDPPKDMKVEQFQIRIPMDPRDVKQSQDEAAGTGAPRRKRG